MNGRTSVRAASVTVPAQSVSQMYATFSLGTIVYLLRKTATCFGYRALDVIRLTPSTKWKYLQLRCLRSHKLIGDVTWKLITHVINVGDLGNRRL
jgi:hypothetical protein